jgi:transposase
MLFKMKNSPIKIPFLVRCIRREKEGRNLQKRLLKDRLFLVQNTDILTILGWSDWRVISIEDRSSEYLIEAEKSTIQRVCLHCGRNQVYRHGRKRQIFLDTPVHGKRSALLVHRRRFLCQSCHCSFLEPLAEMHPAHFMTTRLVSYIEQQALRHTFVSVAENVGVTEGTLLW